MKRRFLHLVAVPFMVLFFGLAVAAGLGLGGTLVEQAQAQGSIFYVDDDVCPAVGSGTTGVPYCRIQTAVGAASSDDQIHVAAGTYTGTQMVLDGRTGFTYTQVAFITKSLTLRGGYDAGDWNAAPDPVANRTIIDAERSGRGISIVGIPGDGPAVTVDGFTITGGDYTGLGNPPGTINQVCRGGEGTDCGGGLYAYEATLVLQNGIITGNVASRVASGRTSDGGGVYLWLLQSESSIENTTVVSNSVSGLWGSGGGIAVRYGSGLTVTQSTIEDNHTLGVGGGMNIYELESKVLIERTEFVGNEAREAGAIMGRLNYAGEALRMDRVWMVGNKTTSYGAAMSLDKAGSGPTTARLTNLLLADNHSTSNSDTRGIINVEGGDGVVEVMLAHVTVADNQARTFLCAYGHTEPVMVTLSNTLLVSSTNGYVGRETGSGEVLIRHTNTLTRNVTTLHGAWEGTPTFEAVNTLTGDPKLDGSYHLQHGSAAIDAGVEAGVMHDIDGRFRPQGLAPDIGVDEYLAGIVSPTELTVSGPITVPAQKSETFVATISPITATAPFTYVWQAIGQSPVTHTNRGSRDTASFVWDTVGTKTITATASNVTDTVASTHTVYVSGVPILVIGKSGPSQALAGSSITYTLTVTNEGIVAADDLVITDALPVGAHYTSGGAYDPTGQAISWTVASLSAGISTTVQFVVTATQTITNTDYGVSASGGYSGTGEIPVVTIVGTPILSISKSGPYSAGVGDSVTYDLIVTNQGLLAATDLVITDTLPAGAHHVSGGTLVGNKVRWNVANLAGNGNQTQVSFVVTATETITNTHYQVSAAAGFSGVGAVPVITIIGGGGRAT